MDWFEARTFCRNKYKDLSSISSWEENRSISSLLRTDATDATDEDEDEDEDENNVNSNNDEGDVRAWIGLVKEESWQWSDGASYRRWAEPQGGQTASDGSRRCGLMNTTLLSTAWHARTCTEKHPFICYS
ncbi:C-type lectin BfL-2-like, partial [Centroberyx affinis]|uniref:C-type lectin BfL-2-like n=1 Tax=Centroberyx affinis TaxID=166261 RepID=UPI003A5BB23E